MLHLYPVSSNTSRVAVSSGELSQFSTAFGEGPNIAAPMAARTSHEDFLILIEHNASISILGSPAQLGSLLM